MWSQLLSVVAPPSCLACRAPVGPEVVLCAGCRRVLPWLEDPCPRCATPRPCGRRCPARGAAFAAAWAPVAHDGPARELVLALKERGARPAADVMAAQLAARLPRAALARAGTVLVPVPASPRRRRARGLDHVAVLAAALSERTGLPVHGALAWREDRSRQAGRGRRERRRDAGALRVLEALDAPVLLVDDVHTTGATLHVCAGALRAAGSPQAVAATYARALTRA